MNFYLSHARYMPPNPYFLIIYYKTCKCLPFLTIRNSRVSCSQHTMNFL